MTPIHLGSKLQLFRGKLFDAFKVKKSRRSAKSEADSDEDPESFLTYINNLLVLFYQMAIFFFNKMICNVNE